MSHENDTFQYFMGGLLRVVSNAVSGRFTKMMAAKGVSVGEWMVLRTLYETGLTTPSAIATYASLTRGAVSKIVDKLIDKDLAVRTEHATDRRYQELALTPRAKKLVPDLYDIAEENDRQFFSNLSEADFQKLRELLETTVQENKIKGAPLK